MARPKLNDPVAVKDETPSDMETIGIDAVVSEVPEEIVELESLKLSDLSTLSGKVTRGANPFDGYPVEKIKIGMAEGKPVMIPKHSIVVLSPDHQVIQDPAGLGRTRTAKSGKVEHIDFETVHSRLVIDSTGNNVDVVFDRKMVVEGKALYYAIIHDHVARSQVIFKIKKGDKKASWSVDSRYKLLDSRQASRLSKVFRLFFAQQFKGESNAEFHESYKEN